MIKPISSDVVLLKALASMYKDYDNYFCLLISCITYKFKTNTTHEKI